MMAGKVVGLGFEIISKLDSYFLMTVKFDFIAKIYAPCLCKCIFELELGFRSTSNFMVSYIHA